MQSVAVVALRASDRLRAIPWVFAWTQIRLMLPRWLGADEAVQWLCANPTAYEALRTWPFFAMQFDMLATPNSTPTSTTTTNTDPTPPSA